MTTLASLTVNLGIDANRLQAGAAAAARQIRAIGLSADQAFVHADGRMRDSQGRFISTSRTAGQAARDIRQGWRGVIDVMANVGNSVRNRVSGPLSAVGSIAQKSLGPAKIGLLGIAAGAVGAGAILAGLPLAVVGLGAAVAAQNTQVKSAFTDLKTHVMKTMQGLVKPMVGPMVQAAGQLRATFDQLGPQLGQLFQAAAPMIKPLVGGIGDLVKGLVSGLVPVMKAAQPFVEVLGKAFGQLGSALGGLFKGLSSGLSGASSLFSGLFDAIGTLLPTLGDLLGTILEVAGPVLGQLLSGLSPVIAMLGTALKPIIIALKPVLAALVKAIMALFQAVLPLLPVISQLVVAVLPALVPVIMALVPLIGALGEIIAALIPILIPIIEVVGKLATILGQGLALVINSVLVPAVQAIAALLRGDFSQAGQLAGKAMSGMVKLVIGLFTTLPQKVFTAIHPLISKVGGVIAQAGSSALGKLKQWLGQAVRWIASLPGKALGALGNLGNVLAGAGAALIRGFVRGIKNSIGSVKSTLQGLTSNLTSWKGPVSLDKRILTPAGRMVIAGFQRGITRQAPLLRRQLQGLTADLPGMTADITPRGVMRSTSRAEQRVVFDVTGADEDMKRLIRRIVKTQGRGSVQTAFGQ